MATSFSLRSHIYSAAIIAALILGACSHTVQYTSGQDYLAGYADAPTFTSSSTDLDVKEIAAVEPNLRFPARIGLARIEKGRLITLPTDEAQDWRDMTTNLGEGYGEFIPVSPLIASMVNPSTKQNGVGHVVQHIRRGAARQHLDYVLIYEVTDLSHSDGNALQVADLSILGLFILPSRNVEVESTATAMLIDVRNGYPYGAASAFADKKALSTVMGKNGKVRVLSEKARQLSVKNLTKDITKIIEELKTITLEKSL